jgi:hypothetical protein
MSDDPAGMETLIDLDYRRLSFVAEDGSEVALRDWRGTPVLLVFLRWLG